MRFEPTTHWYAHKVSQNVLDHVTIIIARSNLLNMGFFTCFVLSWCALVDKLNTHVVNRASSLKFKLKTRGAAAFKFLGCLF